MLPRSLSSRKPRCGILRQHFRHMHAGGVEQLRDVNERFAVFVLRRRIHHDAGAAVGKAGAEIAAEAGIGRGWGQVKDCCGNCCLSRIRFVAGVPCRTLLGRLIFRAQLAFVPRQSQTNVNSLWGLKVNTCDFTR